MKIDGFIEKIINVYRTQYYIVVQRLGVDIFENCELYSFDTLYKRNKQRDIEYERIFKDRYDLNGRRIKTALYARTIIN